MRKQTTFRLKETTRLLLDAMAKQEDLSRTAMLDLIVKEEAKRRDIQLITRELARVQQDKQGE